MIEIQINPHPQTQTKQLKFISQQSRNSTKPHKSTMKSSRSNYKSSLLLAWIIGFTAFNIWFMRLTSFHTAGRTEFKSRSISRTVDFTDNARDTVYYDSMVDDFEQNYDDDNHHTYSADVETLPQWEESSADVAPNEGEEELSVLGELGGGKRGKIAWLMRYVASFDIN